MTSLFFYGTLRHVPLLAAVLAREPDDLRVTDAMLPGHAIHAVQGEVFPMLVRGSGAKGILVEGLSPDDVARLRFYEGGYDYDLETVEVQAGGRMVAAEVFFPAPGLWQPDGPWSLEAWAESHGTWSVLGAIEEMSYFGERSRDEVDRMLPMIRARATAKVNARARNAAMSPGGLTEEDVSDVTVTRPYAEYFALEHHDLRFRRYDGSMSEAVRRAVFVATDAVILLPYDPVRDRVLLVEQFRVGPFARGDALPWQLEPIAGRIDGKEKAEETAHREAWEESRLRLHRLEEVSRCYASPGCSTEYFHVFVGLADLPDGIDGVSGLEEEAEDIRSFLFSYDDFMSMADQGQLVNAPLLLAAFWLARHRERLRAGGQVPLSS